MRWIFSAALLLSALFLWQKQPEQPAAEPIEARTPASQAPAPAPLASAPSAEEGAPALEAAIAQLAATAECLERDCGYPSTDPKSYELAVGQALRQQLEALRARAAGANSPELKAVALRYLSYPDGHVQEAALALLATQAPAPEALEAILEHVVAGHDSLLIAAALRELSRYTDADSRAKITRAFADALATGSPLVAKEIAGAIEPFLAEENLSRYEAAVETLSPISLIRQRVEAATLAYRQSR